MSIRAQWLDSFEAAGLRQFSSDLIMADPPWRFENYSAKGEAKNPIAHYDCMTTQDICDMPVGELAKPDCILWLWATHPMLQQGLDVLRAWGFEYKTGGVWVKLTKNDKLGFGTGYCLRSASEPFLIGTMGKPRFAKTVRTVVEGPLREHSRKPEEAYAAAVELAPDAVTRADIFTRERRSGWIAWGNEVGKLGEG
jgi:N6-adenosine-specific RNA methylase IME4